MAGGETRHRTVVEIGVDDRQVRGLGQTMERAFDPAIIEGFERSLERLDRTLQRLADSMEKAGGGGGAGRAPRAPTGGGGGGGGPGRPGAARDSQGRYVGAGGGGGGSPFWATAGGAFAGTLGAGVLMQMMGRAPGAFGSMATGRGFVGSMASALPVIGPALGGAVQGIGGFYQQYAQQQGALAEAYGRTGLTRGATPYGAGIRYGVGPTAMAGLMQNYAGQTGMQGAGLAGIAPQLIEAERVRGFGGLGAILGGAGAAGGQVQNPQKLLEDSISTGFQLGIRESRMDQYFMQMGGWIESVRNQGINLSPDSAQSLVRVFGNLGMRGMAGVRAAQSFQQSMGRLGRGGGGAGSVLALRAAGLAGGGFGNLSLVQAQRRAEERPEEVMANLAEMLRGSATDDPEAMSLMIRSYMGSLGVDLSASAALNAANEVLGGGDLADMATGKAAAAAQKARRTKGAAGTFGAAAHEAAMEQRRGATGAKMAATQREIDRLEIKLAEKTLPAFADATGKAVGVLNELVEAFGKGGLGGLTAKVSEMTVSASTVVINQVEESIVESGPGRAVLEGMERRANRKAGVIELPGEPGREIAGYTSEMRNGRRVQVPFYADETGGSAKEKEAYHLRKAADAAEQAARESRAQDNQLGTAPN